MSPSMGWNGHFKGLFLVEIEFKWLHQNLVYWGPFLESPGNFTGPKSNIQIEI